MTIASWLPTGSLMALGLLLGLKHALDADHLAAVFAIVSEHRQVRHASLVGVLWGVGHAIALLLAAAVIMLFQLRISPRVATLLEGAVAVMLIGLGMNALRVLVRGGVAHVHAHAHGSRVHVHPHLHDGAAEPPHAHHGWSMSPRPMIVGMVHGLAGSASLTLLVIAAIPSHTVALGYVLVFGIGATGGMLFMSALAGLPLHLTAERFRRANAGVRALAGLWSIGFGLFLAYQLSVGGAPL